MISVNKSTNISIGAGRVTKLESTSASSSRTKAQQPSKTLGVGSPKFTTKKSADSGPYSSHSSNSTGTGPNVTISSNPITLDMDPMFAGLTPQVESEYLSKIYRDIYYHDAVAGASVDLISGLPFSEFSLGGISDAKILRPYTETIERLSCRTLMPEIGVDYLVMGVHVSSLLYNNEKKKFTDLMPHAYENLKMVPLPFYSQDPIITVKFEAQVKEALSKDSPRVQRIKSKLGPNLVAKLMTGELELDPLSTLYIPRKTFSTTDLGTSYFKRLLPMYFIEKNLFRGTLVESARRQRGMMHLTMGDGDQWEPTVADMEFMTNLFMDADSDPLGAIIATRIGISTEELRQGGDFWKVSDYADSVFSQKCRALGIGEGLLSGEATLNTADASLTIFVETLRAFRDMLTRKVFYDKLFPLISMLNGYTLNSKGKLVIKDNLMDSLDPEDALSMLQDGSKLLIPTVSWAKQLKPEGDSAYLEMLDGLTAKGIPVPLRVMAAAGGLSLDELLRQQDDDLEVRKRIGDYKVLLDALSPQGGGGEGDDEGEVAEASAALVALASVDPTGKNRSAVQARGGKKALLNRNFGNTGEVVVTGKTGKRKYVPNQRAANDKINMNIVRALQLANSRSKKK